MEKETIYQQDFRSVEKFSVKRQAIRIQIALGKGQMAKKFDVLAE
jgi:hypothetical protein